MAKFALRGVNFSCSLIVLAMISTSFSIFNATKALPAQNGLPAWAEGTNSWPQKLVLAISCISLLICVTVFIGYCRGGHRRAEKVAVYYTLFAVAWFIVSMILWAVAAGILQFTRNNSGNKDMWGWSCVQNTRSEIFHDKVDYALVCRLQVRYPSPPSPSPLSPSSAVCSACICSARMNTAGSYVRIPVLC